MVSSVWGSTLQIHIVINVFPNEQNSRNSPLPFTTALVIRENVDNYGRLLKNLDSNLPRQWDQGTIDISVPLLHFCLHLLLSTLLIMFLTLFTGMG